MARRSKGKARKGGGSATAMVSGQALSHGLDAKHRKAEALKARAAELRVAAKAAGVSKAEALALRAEARGLMTQAVALDVELVAGHAAAMERVAVGAGLTERLGLEEIRLGKKVEALKVKGAEVKRISDYDGLAEAHLDSAIEAAGFRFRDIYRLTGPSYASPLSRLGMVGGTSGNATEDGMLAAIDGKRKRDLVELLKRLTRQPGVTPEHLEVLYRVAGDGQSLRQYAGGGGRKAMKAKAMLVEVLGALIAVSTPSRGCVQVARFGDS